jgi:hypothetical protein
VRQRATQLKPGDEVVLGMDGSLSGDASALSVCTLDYHLAKTFVWEGDHSQSSATTLIPRNEVDSVVRELFRTHRSGACGRSLGLDLGVDRLAAVVRGRRRARLALQQLPRYGPISDRFFVKVMDGKLTHEGDKRLHHHVLASNSPAS